MARVYNFSAGPATMPLPVLEEIQAELLDYKGSGMSVMEMSHRSKVFDTIIKEAEADLRELMNIPDGEVYTAPVRESMNGHISYNTQSLEMGFTYENVRFEIKDGKIVNATANDNERIFSAFFSESKNILHRRILTDSAQRNYTLMSFGYTHIIKFPSVTFNDDDSLISCL